MMLHVSVYMPKLLSQAAMTAQLQPLLPLSQRYLSQLASSPSAFHRP